MTMGFGFTNVGATTFALQSADRGAKELSLGISRASTSVGQAIGPLVCGALMNRWDTRGISGDGADLGGSSDRHLDRPKTTTGVKRFEVQCSKFKVRI